MTGPIVQPPYVLGGVHAAPAVTTGWDLPPIPTGPVTELGDLDDVDTTGSVTGQVLTRSSDGIWRGAAIPHPAPYVISSAQNPWVIDHNLGYAPGGITLIDSTGTEIEGDPSYPIPASRLVITFPFGITVSGTAYLS